MTVYQTTLSLQSHGGTPSFINITQDVRQAIADSGINAGVCSVITPHTTCSVYYDEYAHDEFEDGTDYLQYDLNQVLGRIIPDQIAFPPADGYNYPGEEHFREVETWDSAPQYLPGGDRSQLLNADAHLKSTIIGTSQNFAVIDGKLGVGVTGYVFFADWDRARGRSRKCYVTVIGE